MIKRFALCALFSGIFVPQTTRPTVLTDAFVNAVASSGIVERLILPTASGGAVFLGTAGLLKWSGKKKLAPKMSRSIRFGASALIGILTMSYLADGGILNELKNLDKKMTAEFAQLNTKIDEYHQEDNNNFNKMFNAQNTTMENQEEMKKKLEQIFNLLKKNPTKLDELYQETTKE